jgi:hypothetical protein
MMNKQTLSKGCGANNSFQHWPHHSGNVLNRLGKLPLSNYSWSTSQGFGGQMK